MTTITAVDVFAVDFGDLVSPEEAKEPGGLLETSLLLHLKPELVQETGRHGPDNASNGGSGTRRSSAELGERLYALILERIARYLTQR